MKNEIILYTEENGKIDLKVNLYNDTVWLSLKQLAILFDRNKSTISRHINNIFKTQELDRNSVVADFAITASDGKTYLTTHYNLDLIISLGYRVNSKQGIKFRKWASNVIKSFLIKGYSINEKRLQEIGTKDILKAIKLLGKTLSNISTYSIETIISQIVMSYTKAWDLLHRYDENSLEDVSNSLIFKKQLDYKTAKSAIKHLKEELIIRKEASQLFGQEVNQGLENILKNIEQTIGNQNVYKSIEEKSAHLLMEIKE